MQKQIKFYYLKFYKTRIFRDVCRLILYSIKVHRQAMAQKLNVKVILGGRQAEYPLEYNFQDGYAKVEIRKILIIVDRFIIDKNYFVNNYLNIWIVTNNGKQNLFKMRKNNSAINLTHNENGQFEIKIILEDIEDKQNLLKFFHNNSEQYTRLSNNINKIIEESKQQQKKRGQKCMRPIDIAYFFADPLVNVTKSGQINPKYEVSYQLEYDKFIELVKKEEFGNNFRIQMMVATRSNIKKTLIAGASILHFACHGKKYKGNLQIESETSQVVGELVDLQHNQFINLLDIKTALPKLIIFNVCYSSVLAKMISSSMKIITIGYNDEAKDVFCQEFTKQFYLGLFKNREPVRQLFHRIKDQLLIKYPAEVKKLQIYPEVPFPDQQTEVFVGNTESKLNFVKKWTYSESMRQNDSLGVKCQMYTFIKQYLTNEERISYLFLKGQKRSGKSDFMKKTRIYVMNRKVFTQDFMIDLKNLDGSYIQTILQLRLQKEDLINKKMSELKELFKQRRTNPLIILDHNEKILKLQYGKFIEYVQTKFIKELKYGKVIIITNNITPIIKGQAEDFKKAHFHMKISPNIQRTEFTNYIERYASEDIKSPALKIYDARLCPDLKLLKAIKSSKSQKELTDQCLNDENVASNIYQTINLQYIEQNIRQFQKMIQEIAECVNIKIQDNDYIFLSTIFLEIDLEVPQHYTNITCVKRKSSNQIQNLTEKFDIFIKGTFKIFKNQESLFNQMKNKIPVKALFHLSLKIGAYIYTYKDFSHLFEKHMLNCQKLYVLVSGFYIDQLKRNSSFLELVATYHLKVLLTLYSYYTESEQSIKNKQFPTPDERQEVVILHRKSQIIIDQIMSYFDKKQYEILVATLKSLFLINNMAQELHYNKEYSLFIQNQRSTRRQSDVFDLSNEEGFDIEQIATIIDQHHRRINVYWNAFKDIEKYERYLKNYDFILIQDSIILIQIVIIKQIVYNLRQLDSIIDKRESTLSQNVSLYINFYTNIMEKIHADKIFGEKQKNGLFNHHNSQSIKPLYQQYLKAFIQTYCKLEKRKQNLTKQYRLPIFLELIELCEKSQNVSGINSIKKMVEMHVNEQFFNTWTCTTFISLPLTYECSGNKLKCNIKRYESHVYRFLQNFYLNQLDKQVKFEVKAMNEEILKQYQKSKKNLIQLVVCDIRQQSEKIYLENEICESTPFYMQILPLPKAPIVIYFGYNVKSVDRLYNKMDIIVIWINIDNENEKRPSGQKQKKNQKYEQGVEVSIHNKKLGIYYSILEYFYCSFCRHFFNGTHSLFIEQVKNSFDLAKAETIIKTKILYSSEKQFRYEKQILSAINQIDNNLSYLLSSGNGQQLARRPAYHFIFKQNKKQGQKAKIKEKFMTQKSSEIGCNFEINQILAQLYRIKQKREAGIIIYYKSQPMLNFFIRTLRIKIIKGGMFKFNQQITDRTYKQYREQMTNRFNQSALSQIQQTSEDNIAYITPFINLQEDQVTEELRSLNVVKNSTIRLFFTRKKYYLQKDLEKSISKVMSIEENYKSNKPQFEYFYLQCKAKKPHVEQKKIIDRYKSVIKETSSSLQDIKTTIQKL